MNKIHRVSILLCVLGSSFYTQTCFRNLKVFHQPIEETSTILGRLADTQVAILKRDSVIANTFEIIKNRQKDLIISRALEFAKASQARIAGAVSAGVAAITTAVTEILAHAAASKNIHPEFFNVTQQEIEGTQKIVSQINATPKVDTPIIQSSSYAKYGVCAVATLILGTTAWQHRDTIREKSQKAFNWICLQGKSKSIATS